MTMLLAPDFCKFCGAGIPPKYGEGTCIKCDPKGVAANIAKQQKKTS